MALDFAALMAEERARARAEAAAAAARDRDTPAGEEPPDWGALAVPGAPGVWYAPGFVDAAAAAELERRIYACEADWQQLPGRRLQIWGGTPHPDGMQRPAEPLPAHLAALSARLAPFFPDSPAPNHVLLNEYSGGQGIAAHKDGPLYHPRAAILSLRAPALLWFYDAPEMAPAHRVRSVLLEPNSLLVFSREAYEDLWHCIEPAAAAAGDVIDALCANRPADVPIGTALPRGGTRLSVTMRAARMAPGEALMTTEAREEAARRAAWFKRSISEAALG